MFDPPLYYIESEIKEAEGYLNCAALGLERISGATDKDPGWEAVNRIAKRLREISEELKTILLPIDKEMKAEQEELEILEDKADARSL